LDDVIKLEFEDRQFLALKNLFENKKFGDKLYLLLIVLNALVSYQLSWTWEKYWQEFADYAQKFNFSWKTISKQEIFHFFENLLTQGKYNKRFKNTKLARIQKFLDHNFFDEFLANPKFYYQSMKQLNKKLAQVMNQPEYSKTIVFAVKMFSYWARNVFEYIEYFPFDIQIPVDSRLKKLYENYVWKKSSDSEIRKFYYDLAYKVKIPPLHLDALLWMGKLDKK
jgi:DNA-(apurinic or apyrimidinic site) lyase